MDITISELIHSIFIDKFENNEEISRFTQVINETRSPFSNAIETVDIQITSRGVLVTPEAVVIFLPNGSVFSANIPSVNYLTIEVM